MSKATHQEELQARDFLLPHEYTEVLNRLGSRDVLLDTQGMDPKTLQHLNMCKRKSGASEMLALGLWGDGVPVNWDRTESVETFSINLPGLSGKYHGLRLPITGFSRKQVSSHTWHDLMQVIAWSLQCCADGFWPLLRHDGSPWIKTDTLRAKTKRLLGHSELLGRGSRGLEVFWGNLRFSKMEQQFGHLLEV